MQRRAFTLIELIVVIAILAVLVGVAVPYYQDSIADARRSTLRSNLATIRDVINKFRGDQGRGPLRVANVDPGTGNVGVDYANGLTSELVAGPIQYVNGSWMRRNNVRYLAALPVLEDPQTGERKPVVASSGATTWYVDTDADNAWDITTELAWQPLNQIAANASANPTFQPGTDTALVQPTTPPVSAFFGSQSKSLDFIDVVFTSAEGVNY